MSTQEKTPNDCDESKFLMKVPDEIKLEIFKNLCLKIC